MLLASPDRRSEDDDTVGTFAGCKTRPHRQAAAFGMNRLGRRKREGGRGAIGASSHARLSRWFCLWTAAVPLPAGSSSSPHIKVTRCGRALAGSSRIVVGANSIDHNPNQGQLDRSGHSAQLPKCVDDGLLMQHTRPANDPVTCSMELRGCQNVNIAGIQILGARGRGIALEDLPGGAHRRQHDPRHGGRQGVPGGADVDGKCAT